MNEKNVSRMILLEKVKKSIGFLLKILVLAVFFVPFYWMVITAFKTPYEASLFPPTWWPETFSLESFREVFRRLDVWMYLKNTIIITLSVLTLQTIIMVPSAYAFARYEFKGKKCLFALVMVALMVPQQITFISTYLMFSKMDLLRTLLPQILPLGASAYGIFMLRQRFMQIDDELVEAARLDQAGELKIMLKVMLPIAKPTMVIVLLLNFISVWNSYFWPLVMCNSEEVKPVTLAVAKLKNIEDVINWPLRMSGNLLLLIPIFAFFLLTSKKIISSLSYGGTK